MQREAAAFIDEMRQWAVDITRRGAASGQMRYAGTPEAIGMMLFSALQGALQLARIDDGALDTIKRQVRAVLGLPDIECGNHDNK